MKQLVITKQGCNTRLFWHMQIAQCRTYTPFISTQLINKLLPRIFRMNIQANA
ncbi:Uncharacterised protein [Shigella flexneri]|nr:Uncharacterised protein [Shigella flexneri]